MLFFYFLKFVCSTPSSPLDIWVINFADLACVCVCFFCLNRANSKNSRTSNHFLLIFCTQVGFPQIMDCEVGNQKITFKNKSIEMLQINT